MFFWKHGKKEETRNMVRNVKRKSLEKRFTFSNTPYPKDRNTIFSCREAQMCRILHCCHPHSKVGFTNT
jgi:hypothetical protein